MNETMIRSRAQQYGYFGLLPFLAPAALVWILPEAQALNATSYFVSYSAIILSFLSGIIWAPAILAQQNKQNSQHTLTAAILVSLLAWLSLLLPSLYAAWLLLAMFNVTRRVEGAFVESDYAPWYSELRDRLTRVVTGSHLSVGVFLLVV